MANDWAADAGQGAVPERVSTRRALVVFATVLTLLAFLLLGGFVGSARLRPSTQRIPAATFAARQGVVLPDVIVEVSPTPVSSAATPGTSYACASTGCRTTVTRGGTPQSLPGVPGGTTSRPTDSPLAREVAAAYIRAWEVWAEACLTLDPAALKGVFAPPELDRAHAYVRQLGASGRLMRLDAAHRVTVLAIDGDTALLLDELTDRSLYLDPATRQPLALGAQPTPIGTERVRCRLQRTESGWRVAELSWGR